MHGRNFFRAYCPDKIRLLAVHGFRVFVPDQVGFGKSSKPDIYYSLHLLTHNTKRLLDELRIEKVAWSDIRRAAC
jgi:pimeloyl-ACP methyl ester carboxylesterase